MLGLVKGTPGLAQACWGLGEGQLWSFDNGLAEAWLGLAEAWLRLV